MARGRPSNKKKAAKADGIRSHRKARGNVSNLAGFDPNSDDDEEYNDNEPEGDHSKMDSTSEEEDSGSIRNRSNRKRKIESDDDEEEESRIDDNDAYIQDEKPDENKVNEDEGEDEDADEDEEEDDEEEEEEEDEEGVRKSRGKAVTPKRIIVEEKRRGPKRRGRKKNRLTATEDGYFDEEGNALNVLEDEVILDDEDPKGQEKIDKDGNLIGDRKFRVKTFTVLGNGSKQFMVSTEPARLVGFRDSYLLFKTHKNLFKKVCTQEEKLDLIDRHIIPNSYKGRSVNLVAARSIFREFGAVIIQNGKKVIDDFWEQRAIDNGDVAGEYADPAELYGNQFKTANPAGEGGSNTGSTPVSGIPLVSYQTDPTWMYQIALQTRDYNSSLLKQRSETFLRGVRDTYSGLTFYPAGTQPTRFKVRRKGEKAETESLYYDSEFYNPNIRRKTTGLSTVPANIFSDVDEETMKAILEQQKYEKSVQFI